MPHLTATIFAVLSLVFAGLTARDYWRGGGKLSLSAKAWRRIAVIFAIVAMILTATL